MSSSEQKTLTRLSGPQAPWTARSASICCQNLPPFASTARWAETDWKAPSRMDWTPLWPQHPALHTTDPYPLRRPRCSRTSSGSFPFRVSTTTPSDWRLCLWARVRESSFWIASVAASAADWYSIAASAALSASPVSMASLVARAAFAAASAAAAAARAAPSAWEDRPLRRRTRVGLRPAPLQKLSTSTPAGRLGSALSSGRFSRSVASKTRMRSTPAGRSFPKVDSHLSPLSRDLMVLFSTMGPLLPSRGKVPITASTCE
mmetsp:Transcript_5959/g.12527  ORF Transcript_5959/g.12527 Transcript_5959/m.12527 type:complete len:261 (-) Transcript_5959:1306-2088(-)